MDGIKDPAEGCDTGIPNDTCFPNCTRSATEFYADNIMPQITVTLIQAHWDLLATCTRLTIKQQPRPRECDYHDATCDIAYASYSAALPCLVRRKGSYSWRPMRQRPALKIKLVSAWRGMRRFTLNNMVQDSGQLNERVGYRMYSMVGLTAPRANLARVALRIEGTPRLFSNYLNLESYNDQRFLTERFVNSENGTLYDHMGGNGFKANAFKCKRGCTTAGTHV